MRDPPRDPRGCRSHQRHPEPLCRALHGHVPHRAVDAETASRLARGARAAGHHALVGGCCSESTAILALLEASGFSRVGHFPEVGRKFDRWLLNYCPHLYQVPGHTPVNDYARAAMDGDMNRAVEICRSINPLRSVLAKWIPGYGGVGRLAIAEQKFWMECIGMAGGPVRVPCAGMTEDMKKQMRADLEATGLPAKARAAGLLKRAA